ncbi:flavodoxin family protein [Paenibacillus timonensis]|nr:NAD(P)H-dependent oxidoreductase [Paenibacillus timonensis]MUG87775.1 flavodoxin family protein [Paenibacillus timonensis]
MNVLVINGHPNPESYCTALAGAYRDAAASQASAKVREIDLSRSAFDLILKYGYRQRTELEDELREAQELIRWADHLVFVYPTWWGTMPAVLKGFFDRVFLPGFAYKHQPNSLLWDKLLKGKTAHLIVTMDTPSWYNRWFYKRAGHRVMRNNILGYCGIKTVRITEFNRVSSSQESTRLKWLEKVKKLGSVLA